MGTVAEDQAPPLSLSSFPSEDGPRLPQRGSSNFFKVSAIVFPDRLLWTSGALSSYMW
jgi:hypothetical protein